MRDIRALGGFDVISMYVCAVYAVLFLLYIRMNACIHMPYMFINCLLCASAFAQSYLFHILLHIAFLCVYVYICVYRSEFLKREGLTGHLHGLYPPGNRSDIWGVKDLWPYLDKVCIFVTCICMLYASLLVWHVYVTSYPHLNPSGSINVYVMLFVYYVVNIGS